MHERTSALYAADDVDIVQLFGRLEVRHGKARGAVGGAAQCSPAVVDVHDEIGHRTGVGSRNVYVQR